MTNPARVIYSGPRWKGRSPLRRCGLIAPSAHEITFLLTAWRDGDQAALDRLMPLVYAELRRLAHHHMKRENPGHVLQTTAVVHEAYIRLLGQKDTDWQGRTHFFAVAAKVMRNLLVDQARSRLYGKRGGGARHVELDQVAVMAPERDAELLALDEALARLAELDPRKSQIVEMRYFGGLSAAEAAQVLGVSEITVKRDWLAAKAWLHRELSREARDES